MTAKLGGAELDSATLTMLRLAFATVALGGQVLATRAGPEVRALCTAAKPFAVVLTATVLATYIGLWLSMIALQLTLAGIAATLTSTSPIFVLPLVRIFEKEHVSGRAVVGSIVAVVGVAILIAR